MYKLLVSNFYKTLINDEEAINLSTMIEIDRIRKNNVLFAIATNEDVNSILDYNKDFPFIDYIIAFNGACLYDVDQEKLIYKNNIMPSIIKKINKLYRYVEMNLYTSDKVIKICNRDFFEQVYNDNKTSIYKMELILNTKKQRDNIYDEIGDLNLKVTLSKKVNENKKYIVEIYAGGVNKIDGVNIICDKHKISLMEVVSIGCDDNDTLLLESSGMPTCVSNATKEIKKIVKIKSSSNLYKGVEKIIKKIF